MEYISLVLSVVIAQAVGGVGSIFTIRKIPGWYATLVRPKLSPPNWVFGPVWTTLYLLMGIAAWLVYSAGWALPTVQLALGMYALQLVLNALWSYLFFGKHQLRLAFLELCALWFSIVVTMYLFAGINMLAAYLLVPYLAWVSFAGYLNSRLAALNR